MAGGNIALSPGKPLQDTQPVHCLVTFTKFALSEKDSVLVRAWWYQAQTTRRTRISLARALASKPLAEMTGKDLGFG